MKVLIKYLFESEAEYVQFFTRMNLGIEPPAPKPEIIEPVIRKLPEAPPIEIKPEVAPPPPTTGGTSGGVYRGGDVCGLHRLRTEVPADKKRESHLQQRVLHEGLLESLQTGTEYRCRAQKDLKGEAYGHTAQ